MEAGLTDHIWTLHELIGLLKAPNSIAVYKGAHVQSPAWRYLWVGVRSHRHRDHVADELPRQDGCHHSGFHCALWNWIRHRRGPLAVARMGSRTLLRLTTEHPRCGHHKSLRANHRHGGYRRDDYWSNRRAIRALNSNCNSTSEASLGATGYSRLMRVWRSRGYSRKKPIRFPKRDTIPKPSA